MSVIIINTETMSHYQSSLFSPTQQNVKLLNDHVLITLILLPLSLVVRFGLFIPDVITGDESTFILTGQYTSFLATKYLYQN